MIVLNSNFNPYSYQELAAPVLQAEQAHRQIEEEDAQLQAMAGNWKTKLNPELDKKSYAAVADLYGQIEQQAGELASKGLTPGSRKALLNLKANYNTKVSPIEEAYKIRQMRADELAKMKMQDPTTLHDLDPGMLSVDDFVSNPNKRVNTYSGALITKQVADAAEQMSKSLRDDPAARAKWHSILGGQHFEKLEKYGFSNAEVMNAIQRNPKAMKELTGIVDGVMSTTGIDKWNNPDSYQRALQFANQGLYHAIGTSQYKYQDDKSYMNPLQRLQYAKTKQEMEAAVANDKPDELDRTYGFLELNKEQANRYSELLNRLYTNGGNGSALSKYFGKDGKSNPYAEYNKWVNKDKEMTRIRAQVIAEYHKNMKKGEKESYNNNSSTKNDWKYNPAKHPELYKGIMKGYTWEQLNAPRTTNGRPQISDKDLQFFKELGITDKDNYKTVREKILKEQKFAQTMTTGYSLGLNSKGLDNAYQEIERSAIRNNNRSIEILDKNLKPTGEYADISDLEDGYVKERHGSRISEMLYVAGLGRVVMNHKGQYFRVSKISDQMENWRKELEDPGIKYDDKHRPYQYMGLNAYMAIARNPNASDEERNIANEKIKEISRAMVRKDKSFFGGFENTPTAPETSSKFSPYLLQD